MLEKDINACNLDVKNETSWTSWAMTSLSAKLTDYKSKTGKQQASIALSSTGESKKAIENSSTNKQTENPVKVEANKTPVKPEAAKKPEEKFSSPFESSFDSKPTKGNNESGWGDDNQWQDFADDDDDQMEPLEPFTATSSFSSSQNKITDNTSSTKTTNESSSGGGGWEETKWGDEYNDEDVLKQTKTIKKATNSTSSTNWNVPNKINTKNDEEALFSSLVKDVNRILINLNY